MLSPDLEAKVFCFVGAKVVRREIGEITSNFAAAGRLVGSPEGCEPTSYRGPDFRFAPAGRRWASFAAS